MARNAYQTWDCKNSKVRSMSFEELNLLLLSEHSDKAKSPPKLPLNSLLSLSTYFELAKPNTRCEVQDVKCCTMLPCDPWSTSGCKE